MFKKIIRRVFEAFMVMIFLYFVFVCPDERTKYCINDTTCVTMYRNNSVYYFSSYNTENTDYYIKNYTKIVRSTATDFDIYYDGRYKKIMINRGWAVSGGHYVVKGNPGIFDQDSVKKVFHRQRILMGAVTVCPPVRGGYGLKVPEV